MNHAENHVENHAGNHAENHTENHTENHAEKTTFGRSSSLDSWPRLENQAAVKTDSGGGVLASKPLLEATGGHSFLLFRPDGETSSSCTRRQTTTIAPNSAPLADSPNISSSLLP